MTQSVRLGFIGCGGHARRHAEVALKMPDIACNELREKGVWTS